jgi:hypothetical protein
MDWGINSPREEEPQDRATPDTGFAVAEAGDQEKGKKRSDEHV